MPKISKRVLTFRERQRRGAIMHPGTFAEIEREAAAGGARDPRAVAGAAYWKTLAAKYRNPATVYGKAASLGYPYIRGEGKPSADGRVWLGRFTKTGDENSPAVYVGYDEQKRKWIVEYAVQGNPSAKYQVIAVRKGGTVGQTIDMEFPTLKAAKEYAKTIDREVFKKPVVTVKGGRNPDDELPEAERLYETFHGREPREILEITRSAIARGEYTAIGDLVEMTIHTPEGDDVKVGFQKDGVRLASTAEGTQLALLGGNQDVSGTLKMFGSADMSKDLLDLGEAKQIVYDAAKWQTDFTPQEWKHDFGEESGIRPRVIFDQLNKEIFFAGGTYRVERPGIVD